MRSLGPIITAITVFIGLFSFCGQVLADGPRGFRADWHRAEVAVTDALLAARTGELGDVREEGDTANDALLDLASYTPEVPQENRIAFGKALDEARVAAQQLKLEAATQNKDAATTIAQNALQKFTAIRPFVPQDWFRSTACTGMRKQRRQC